jgi:Helix-turn-helix of DDE superfamily endonuclease
MRYEQVRDLAPPTFKRLVGVSKETFTDMVTTVESKHRAFGRPPKLGRQDQVLLTLMYYREYRTMAHIALAYQVSEPTVFRIIRRVEETLMHSGQFTLPGKKALSASQSMYEIVWLDSFESPIERPKKNSAPSTAARRSNIL